MMAVMLLMDVVDDMSDVVDSVMHDMDDAMVLSTFSDVMDGVDVVARSV